MKVTTSVKIDKDLKEKASKLAREFGLSLSGVVNASLENFVRERQIRLTEHPPFNAQTEKEMKEMLEDVKNNKNIEGPFDSVEEFKKHLLE